MDDRPIGIFDSSSGGLSICASIQAFFPSESIVYVGDHKFAPYSAKTKTCIQKRALHMVEFLVSQDVKLIIIACNTATIAGIDVYRTTFSHVPIIGVVPVIKTAAEKTKNQRIGMLSTIYTKKSAYQKKLIHMFAPDKDVTQIGSARLVSLIETKGVDDPVTVNYIERLIQPLKQKHIDVLVLGCTHYPFIRKHIQNILGDNVCILDSSDPVARHAKRILEKEHLFASERHVPSYEFFTSGNPKEVQQTFQRLLGKEIEVHGLDRVQ